jgi:exodeoxyribonuclease VII large subunit
MRTGDEPPDWVLPAWDATDATPTSATSASPSVTASVPRILPGERIAPAGTFGLRVLGVSEVTKAVRDAVKADDRLRDLWVEGEVGRVTVSSAGHAYFTLKDEHSQLQCVWFRDQRLSSPFEPPTGLRVVAHGRVDVFDLQGVYQLYVSSVQPAGFGDLAIQFEALKARLAAEGLFDAARKRPLPVRPGVIAVATSETGAVWHDIQHVLARRWPLARVVLAPCQVQGEPAPASIVAALGRIARYGERCSAEGRPEDAPSVTILARGGGSLEDLWSFNDERVVRAIVGHPVPVVCGVGHETDVTLTDFAADHRAPTPSAAAEIVVPDQAEVTATLTADARRLEGAMAATLGWALREVAAERRALDGVRPAAQLGAARERAGLLLDRATRAVRELLDDTRRSDERAVARLASAVTSRLGGARGAIEAAGAALAVLAPQATLERGYAIVRRSADGRILRDPDEIAPGGRLAIRLAHGELEASVQPPRVSDLPA